jgi:hypothetical protein
MRQPSKHGARVERLAELIKSRLARHLVRAGQAAAPPEVLGVDAGLSQEVEGPAHSVSRGRGSLTVVATVTIRVVWPASGDGRAARLDAA